MSQCNTVSHWLGAYTKLSLPGITGWHNLSQACLASSSVGLCHTMCIRLSTIDTWGVLGLGWRHSSIIQHDDVMIWKCFLYYWPFVRGIHRSPVVPLTNGSVMHTFGIFFLVSLNELLNKQSNLMIWDALVLQQWQAFFLFDKISQNIHCKKYDDESNGRHLPLDPIAEKSQVRPLHLTESQQCRAIRFSISSI